MIFINYDLDPSICSMINALHKIEAILSEKEDEWMLSFGEWILHNLTFLYFDMETRKNGEETFVVINTTGEPLSATQHLKPLIINADINKTTDNVDKKWEEIETWFWRNRQKDNDTADSGFAEFLRWVSIIEQKDILLPSHERSDGKYLIQQILQGKGRHEFPYKNIAFDTIYKYWQVLVWLMEENSLFSFEAILSPAIKGRTIDQKDCFVLLPVLRFTSIYWEKIKTDASILLNLKRIYKFFENLIRVGNVSKAVNTLIRETLRIVDMLEANGDIVSILRCEDVSIQMLSPEERLKLEILRDSKCREKVEESFWRIQQHNIWSGEILPIIEWASDEHGIFDFNKFSQYVDLLDKLFPGEAEYDNLTHLLRRCMIVNQEHYEPVYRGRYASLGWEWADWRELLCRENDGIKKLFEYILSKQTKHRLLESILEDYIKEFATRKNYIEFAESDYLLSFTNNSGSCDMIWAMNDWQISTSGSSERHTSFFSRRNAYILQAFGAKQKNDGYVSGEKEGWSFWNENGSHSRNCIVFRSSYGIELKTRFISSADNNGGRLEIVLKTTDNNKNTSIYSELLIALGLSPDRAEELVLSESMNAFDKQIIKEKIEAIMNKIEQIFVK